MPRILRPLAAFILGLLLLAGCSSGFKLGGLTVGIVDVKPAPAAGSALITLHFVNENVVPIGITRSSYKLYLNGNYAGKCVTEDAVGLKQTGEGRQTFTFKLDNPEKLRQLAAQGRASYRLESQLVVISGEERIDVNTKGEGLVDLSALVERR
jgi:LEA14-like dessication related protein